MSLWRTRRWLLPLVVALVVLPACGDDDDDDDGQTTGPTSTALDDRLAELSGAGVFVGGVALTGNLVSIHYDKPDDRTAGMKMFVTDGIPGGNAEWFEGTAPRRRRSSSRPPAARPPSRGRSRTSTTDGTITLADGVNRNFFTRPGRRRGGHVRGHGRRRRRVEGHVAQRVDAHRPPDGELRRGGVVSSARRALPVPPQRPHPPARVRGGGRRPRHLPHHRHPPGHRDPGSGRRREGGQARATT